MPDTEIFDIAVVAASLFANVINVVKDNIGAIVALLGFIIGISFVMALMDYAKDMRFLEHEKRRWSAIKGWRTRRGL